LLRIVKQDAATLAYLPGAVFEIYTDEALTVLADETQYITDANGIVEIEIDNGIYYLKEVTAPTGYKLDSTPIMVTIENSELEEVVILNTSDETEEEEDEEEDPQTGTNDYLFLTIGLILLLASASLFLKYRASDRK
jgi:LPXTG-motif cell wall-anchored protein